MPTNFVIATAEDCGNCRTFKKNPKGLDSMIRKMEAKGFVVQHADVPAHRNKLPTAEDRARRKKFLSDIHPDFPRWFSWWPSFAIFDDSLLDRGARLVGSIFNGRPGAKPTDSPTMVDPRGMWSNSEVISWAISQQSKLDSRSPSRNDNNGRSPLASSRPASQPPRQSPTAAEDGRSPSGPMQPLPSRSVASDRGPSRNMFAGPSAAVPYRLAPSSPSSFRQTGTNGQPSAMGGIRYGIPLRYGRTVYSGRLRHG